MTKPLGFPISRATHASFSCRSCFYSSGFLSPSVSPPRSLRPPYCAARAQGEDAKLHGWVWKMISSLLRAVHLTLIPVWDSSETDCPAELALSTLRILSLTRSPAPPCWPAGKASGFILAWRLYLNIFWLNLALAVSSHYSRVQLFRHSTPREASHWDLGLSLVQLLTSWVTLASHQTSVNYGFLLCAVRIIIPCSKDQMSQ